MHLAFLLYDEPLLSRCSTSRNLPSHWYRNGPGTALLWLTYLSGISLLVRHLLRQD